MSNKGCTVYEDLLQTLPSCRLVLARYRGAGRCGLALFSRRISAHGTARSWRLALLPVSTRGLLEDLLYTIMCTIATAFLHISVSDTMRGLADAAVTDDGSLAVFAICVCGPVSRNLRSVPPLTATLATRVVADMIARAENSWTSCHLRQPFTCMR